MGEGDPPAPRLGAPLTHRHIKPGHMKLLCHFLSMIYSGSRTNSDRAPWGSPLSVPSKTVSHFTAASHLPTLGLGKARPEPPGACLSGVPKQC